MNLFNVWNWQGANLATDVAVEICESLKIEIDQVKFYTDSMTSLAWLRSTSKMSVYVSNRVCKVRDRTEVSQWRYVPGASNPADIASRGAKPSQLMKNRLWYEGPTFLEDDTEPEQPQLIEDWAVKEELISYENQLRKISLFCILTQSMEITGFILEFVKSRDLLRRSVRIISWVVLAVRRMKKRRLSIARYSRQFGLESLELSRRSIRWNNGETSSSILERNKKPRN